METTEDHLLNGRVTLLQPKKGYRVAVDPVLLAASVPVLKGQKVLDLGSGTGAVSLCLQARVAGCGITGIENNPAYLELGQQSVALNKWQEHILFMEGQVEAPPAALPDNYFDFVVANPPYYKTASHSASPDAHKNTAHAMDGSLDAWMDCAARFVKSTGWFFMIYPTAEEDDEALAAMNKVFREIRILRIQPKLDAPSKRLILAGRKGGFPTISEAGTLVLHEENGDYTALARGVLWEGKALSVLTS